MALFGALLGLGANLIAGSIFNNQQRRREREQVKEARNQAEFKFELDERRAANDFDRVGTLRNIDFTNTTALKDQDFRNQFKLSDQQIQGQMGLEGLRQDAVTGRTQMQLDTQKAMQEAGFNQQNLFRAQSAALALRGLK
jgi:hypothetical protein